ncbi:MAG: ATP-binding protein [Methanoregula sp.]|nr:ATP-binding protein [Methanoregula sp.]
MDDLIIKTGKKALRPRARIVHTFGDELISSDVVALIELVKNAYDADARRVLIRFSGNLAKDNGAIDVMDCGHGMSLDTVENAWMEPATPYRKRDSLSDNGRRVLGEKGIGRFAASRLAKKLNVITRETGTNVEISAEVDWTRFDDIEKFLDEIELSWETRFPEEICPTGTIKSLCWDGGRVIPEKLEQGTILRMESLKSDWDSEKINQLLEGLSRLVTPKSIAPPNYQLKDSFEIFAEFPKPFEEKTGLIEPPEILKYPHYSLKGSVNQSGDYNFIVKIKGIENEIPVQGNISFENNKSPVCGPFYVDLRVWDRDADSLYLLKEKLGLKLKQVRDLLNSTKGINVFRDGFRIMPFGEQGNDWLQLDKRRYINPTLRISNDQISGYILISADENPEIRDQSNREGFIENPAVLDFKKILTNCLTLLETRRYDARHPKGSTKVVSKSLFSDFTLKTIQNQVSTKYPQDKDLLASIKSKEADLDEKLSQVKEVLSRYQRLATLGKLIDIVLHDGGIPLSILGNETREALDNVHNWSKIGDNEKSLIINHLELILDQSDILQTVFKRIKPFGGRKRGRPEQMCLESAIENAVSLYHREVKNTGASVTLPKTCTMVTVDSAEIQEVIINLLDNSLYWLHKVPKSQREISIEVQRSQNNEVEIFFSDSGPGIEPEFQERIFDPYFSTKADGIGLGLSIAGEIISEYYGGELELMNSGQLPGATFRIILRKRV